MLYDLLLNPNKMTKECYTACHLVGWGRLMRFSSNPLEVARFGLFEADLQRQSLRRRGVPVHLQDKPFQVLALLLKSASDIVTRDELRQQLWSAETFVEFDEGVNAAVGKLRYALGDSAENPVFVETVRGKGYRWVAPVEWVDSNDSISHSTRHASQPESGEGTQLPGRRIFARRILIAAVAALAFLIGAMMLLPRGRVSAPRREFKQRQITLNSDETPVVASALSPDGKYLAYGDSHGLHVKLLETGEVRDVQEPEGLKGTDMYWGLGFWSPDSTRVLAIANLAGSRYQAWTVSALGGTPIKVLDDAAPWIFSPDGSKIVYLTNLSALGYREVWSVETNGEHAERLLEVDENSEINTVQWSPDGRWLGYIKESQYGPRHEVVLETMDLRTGSSRGVLSNEEMREFLWLPQGRIIYTLGNTDIHGFSCNYWEARINPDTGALQGQPRQLTQWAGFSIANTSATADGRQMAFQHGSRQMDIYVGDFDEGSFKLSQPQRLTREEGMNFPTGWTRDGSAVIFGSHRSGHWGLYKQQLNEESVSPVADDLATIPQDTPISPDGTWLLTLEYPKNSPWFLNFIYGTETGFSPVGKLLRIPASGGAPQAVADGILGVRCAKLLSAPCAIASRTADYKSLVFSVLDPVKGAGKTLARFETDDTRIGYDWDLSPDGARIAVFKLMGTKVHIIELSTGRDKEVDAKRWGGLRSVRWSANGRGLFFFSTSATSQESNATLLYLDARGKAHSLWTGEGVNRAAHLSPSPDGRHVAFTVSNHNSNVWVVEDL